MRPAFAGALAAALLPLTTPAQIAAPENWRKESFDFPLRFAPSIPYEGTEHVRFAPDWTRFASERGFTYVILWDIKRRTLEPAEIERALAVYFDGLMETITKARDIPDPGTATAVNLHPLRSPEGWAHALGGRLWTWNGFSRGEPLALHVEATDRACGERTQVLYLFSLAPRTHAAWDELRSIRAATPCAPAAPGKAPP